jgi:general secretion pathway protein D
MTMKSHPSRSAVRRRSPVAVAMVALAAALIPLGPAQGQSESRRNELPSHSAALKSRTPVTVNFVNADLEAVTRAMGAMIQRQIAVDPRVKGTITVYSEQPLTVREAYLNYLAALRGLGFAMVEVGGLLKLVPEADAKLQTGTVSVGESPIRGDQVITQVFSLKHENANNLVAVLRPLISANNIINASPGSNALVITDYADNLQRIGKIIAALDNPSSTDLDIVPLRHAVASDIAVLVQRLADGGAGGAVPGGAPAPAGGSLTVLPDVRSNSLILRAANPARLAQARAIIDKLDHANNRAGGGPGGNIWVVHLKNADAVKLAAVLRAAFAVSSGGAGGGGGGAGLTGPTPTAQPGAQGGGANAANTPVTASAGPSTGGFIQADPATNSLIITAAEPLYRQLRNVIEQLDTRRQQVFVESMIVKVDASKAAEFGFQWQNLFGNKGDSTLVGAGTNFSSGNNNIINLSAATAQGSTGVATAAAAGVPNGLMVGVLKKVSTFYTLGALARFLETNTGANVLSTPTLMTLDNEEAKIVIGQNVPFVTGSFTNTGTGGGATNPFQTVERKDVGLTLRVKPQIGEGGTIRLTIYQENSTVTPGTQAASNGPTTEKSAIETTVVVDDGATIVLGGLLKDEYTDGEGKVPGLGDIPFLGNLFRNDSRTRIKSNLMVFLRPVVVRDQDGATQISLDRYDTIRALQKDKQPTATITLPIGDAPVLPPLRAPEPSNTANPAQAKH